MMYKSIYFTPKETGCRCGKCDQSQGMEERTLRRFDDLRDACGFPLNMSSGYRCPLHQDNPEGAHGDGVAGDIEISRGKAFVVLGHALRVGFVGIGIQQKGGKRFLHLDDSTRPDKLRPTIWSY